MRDALVSHLARPNCDLPHGLAAEPHSYRQSCWKGRKVCRLSGPTLQRLNWSPVIDEHPNSLGSDGSADDRCLAGSWLGQRGTGRMAAGAPCGKRLLVDRGKQYRQPASLEKLGDVDVLLDRVDLVLAGSDRDCGNAVFDQPVGIQSAV